jgi:hypothetical protein
MRPSRRESCDFPPKALLTLLPGYHNPLPVAMPVPHREQRVDVAGGGGRSVVQHGALVVARSPPEAAGQHLRK